jgi:DNA-binding response OmpR family regulator
MSRSFGLLLADDESTIRLPLKVLLSRIPDARLMIAADGAEALRLARESEWDLAILDAMMPGLDGYSVCRELRKTWSAAERAVWILTARTSQMDAAAAEDAGADRMLFKPFDPDDLFSRVDALRRERLGAGAAEASR